MTIAGYSQTAVEYNNRGLSKKDLLDYKGAIVEYNKAIEISPKYAEAYKNRGTAKTLLQDYIGAISDYNKAIEIDSKYAIAYYNRATVKNYFLKDY